MAMLSASKLQFLLISLAVFGRDSSSYLLPFQPVYQPHVSSRYDVNCRDKIGQDDVAENDICMSTLASIGMIRSGVLNEITDADVIAPPQVEEHSHDHEYHPDDTGSNAVTEFLEKLPSSGYDSRLRPNVNGKIIKISCSLYIGTISSVSESDMDFTVDLYLRQAWDDHRLRWNAVELAEHESIGIGGEYLDFLWRPDTYMPNAKLALYHEVTRRNAFMRIMPHGHVKHSVRITVTAHCPMDFRLFPMDYQTCMIIVESFSLPATDLLYVWRHVSDSQGPRSLPPISIGADGSTLPQFVIRGFRNYETLKERLDGRNHSRLIVEIYFARSLGYYLIQIYLPASLVVTISWVSFWISRHSQPARVLLGVTTVLALTLMTGQGISSLPKISYLKAIDLFMIFCFAMVFLALIEYAIVSYAVKRARKKRGSKGAKKSDTNTEGETIASPRRFVPGGLTLATPHSPALMARNPHLRKLAFDAAFNFSFNQSFDDDLHDSTSSAVSGGSNNRRRWQRNGNDRQDSWVISFPPSLPSRIEWLSRFGFPAVFFVFNLVYWTYFLNQNSLALIENAPGFIPFNPQ